MYRTQTPAVGVSVVMFNPRLPLEERLAAAKFIYTNYGEQGRDIALPWLQAGVDDRATMWSEAFDHPIASWMAGPTAPKIVGGIMIAVSGGALLCSALSAACATAHPVSATHGP